MSATLKFAKSHEWVLDNGNGTVTVGISRHATELLGDVVFAELPEIGAETKAGSEFSVVESVKAASDIYAPVSGEVIAVNEALEDAPETINESPLKDGWIARIKLADSTELDQLLSEDAYLATIEE